MQVAVAYVRTVSLNSQRHETVFGDRPALVRFGLVQTRALQVFSGAGGAGDDGDGALSRVRLTLLSPRTAVAVPAASVTVTKGVPLSRARLVILPVLRGRGDLAGVRAVFRVSVFALVVAVLVAVAEICRSEKERRISCLSARRGNNNPRYQPLVCTSRVHTGDQ